jgi:ABC-type multidrug transport system ATPase subunit
MLPVNDGEVVAVITVNSAGKTTLTRVLSGTSSTNRRLTG